MSIGPASYPLPDSLADAASRRYAGERKDRLPRRQFLAGKCPRRTGYGMSPFSLRLGRLLAAQRAGSRRLESNGRSPDTSSMGCDNLLQLSASFGPALLDQQVMIVAVAEPRTSTTAPWGNRSPIHHGHSVQDSGPCRQSRISFSHQPRVFTLAASARASNSAISSLVSVMLMARTRPSM